MSKTTAFNFVQNISRSIQNDRTISSIILKGFEEIGELSEELTIKYFKTYKQPGKDGVIGEAIDLLIVVADLYYIVADKKELHHSLTHTPSSHTDEIMGFSEISLAFNKVAHSVLNTSTSEDENLSQLAALFSMLYDFTSSISDSQTIEETLLNKLNKWNSLYTTS